MEDFLKPVNHLLTDADRLSVRRLGGVVDGQRLARWVTLGVSLAGGATDPQAREIVRTFLITGAKVLPSLNDEELDDWHAGADSLASRSVPLAIAYLKASPDVLPLPGIDGVREWGELGAKLYRDTEKSLLLATGFFGSSARFLDGQQPLDSLRDLGTLLNDVAGHSVDHALNCLDAAVDIAGRLNPQVAAALVQLAIKIAQANWSVCAPFLTRAPEQMTRIGAFSRLSYVELFDRLAGRLGKQTYASFQEATPALGDVSVANQARLIDLASRLSTLSAPAAVAFLGRAPVLLDRLNMDGVERWYDTGLEIFTETGAGGDAYFRLEARRALEVIEELTARVDLADVLGVLRLYCKAVTGRDISVQTARSLQELGIGWVSEDGATTEGTTIYLPDHIEEYPTQADNFAVYKALATHQAAHLEFGSFEFSFIAEGAVLPRRRASVESPSGANAREPAIWTTDMHRFFGLFADRQLAGDLFALVEDMRIDLRIRHEYGGIREISRRLQEEELTRRPNLHFMPLRQAFVESLLRISLDGEVSAGWPRHFERPLEQGIDVLKAMREPGATVEDAAEATLLLYELAEKIPNLPPGDGGYVDEMSIVEMEEEGMNLRRSPSETLDNLRAQELPYETLNPVSYRGDFKPETVQLLQQMRHALDDDEEDLSSESIKKVLEESFELDRTAPVDTDALLRNLQAEAALEGVLEDTDDSRPVTTRLKHSFQVEMTTSHYNEWDFRARDYRPRWCTLHESRITEGELDFFEATLAEHAGLVKQAQRQFELIKPEPFQKLKRLEDGEEIDLDSAIDYLAQRRAGHGDTAKIYWRRSKEERRIAAAFLLDMSSSTEQLIDKVARPRKRIIDLEKESLVLLTQALEISGDQYGIFGFSGDGRQNVEYFVVKEIDEALSDAVRRRIDHITPLDSTRMAPAIRHTIPKLLDIEARARILFLISDGRPQDTGYGAQPGDREYAIHDTHKALMEARQRGITPFLITVDKEGHDYLREMCGDMAYEVVTDISLLPSRLLTLYRMLTAD